MASRTVEGPEKDLLTLSEVAAYLRLKVKTVRRLIASGQFFHPVEISDGVRLWTAEDVAVYRAWRERRHRLRKSAGGDGLHGTPVDNPGTPAANPPAARSRPLKPANPDG